jgi:hypothetical protein
MQDIIVYMIVAGAAVYLGRYVWKSATGKKGCGCGSEGGCATKKAVPAQPELIQISLGSTHKS